jgi:hypothetical protein
MTKQPKLKRILIGDDPADAVHQISLIMRMANRDHVFHVPVSATSSPDAMARAFHNVLKRPSETHVDFTPYMRLDTKQVRDDRLKPKTRGLKLLEIKSGIGNPPDSRLERPAPKTDLRIGAAGRHNLEDTRARMKNMKGAMAGDGSLERPAPRRDKRPGAAGDATQGDAGMRTVPRSYPKKKRRVVIPPSQRLPPSQRRRFNQGRDL